MEKEKDILGLSESWLRSNKAIYTASEISGQPTLWLKTYESLFKVSDALQQFLDKVLVHDQLDIILTGAGTSAYIGETLEGYFKKHLGKSARAVPTTDIVTFPDDCLYKNQPTLLVSFARSGNSPESVAAVEIANKLCDKIYHLIITCNADGKLAKMHVKDNVFCFVLPPESNDKSLAMTGSFTSMLLTGVLIARLKEIKILKYKVDILSTIGNHILSYQASDLKALSQKDFKRAIFLGSGPLQGIARESHLKVQELTDGKVVCQYDSYLGFRHGPKAVIDDSALIVYHFSNDEYAHKYEADLVKDIHSRKDGMFRLGIGVPGAEKTYVDMLIELPGAHELDETLQSVVSVMPAQILAFYKSIAVGLCPDEPSISGNISRVVQGVNIYPY